MIPKKQQKFRDDEARRKHIGARIRRIRRDKEITQVELAAIMENSQSTLSKIETGQLEVGYLAFLRACKVLPGLEDVSNEVF